MYKYILICMSSEKIFMFKVTTTKAMDKDLIEEIEDYISKAEESAVKITHYMWTNHITEGEPYEPVFTAV